jgi:hypothetical protein
MKPFQSRGISGPRDIHKTILNVGPDKFDKNNPTHLEISNVSKKCYAIDKQHIETRQIPEFMNKNELGRQRLNLRELLSSQIELIGRLFEKA